MIRWLVPLALLASPVAAQDVASAPGAMLRAIDKVSGNVNDLEIAAGETRQFGRLTVTLSDCRYPVDDPSSNAFALLTIFDTTIDKVVFDGWMVAASPALSALDHARYDVWVLRCNTA